MQRLHYGEWSTNGTTLSQNGGVPYHLSAHQNIRLSEPSFMPRHLQSLLFVAISALLFTRTLIVRSLDTPWLEDIELLLASLDPHVSIWAPVYDNPVAIQRIIARLVEPLVGLEYGPLVFAILSILFLAYVSTYVVRPGFEWIVPGLRVRVALAFWIALGPGTVDVAGCLINTTYTLSLLVLLMSLERTQGRYLNLAIVSAIAGLSSHTAFIAIPSLLVRILTEKRRWPFVLSVMCIGFSVANAIRRNYAMSASLNPAPATLYIQASLDYLLFWLQSFFVAPITGSLFAYLSKTLWPLNLLLIAGGFSLFIYLCRRARQRVPQFVVAIAAGSLLFATASVVGRTGLYGQSAGDTAFATLSRHNSIYSWTMALAWSALIPWKQLTSLFLGRAMLALQVSVLLYMWFIRIAPPRTGWAESITRLRIFAHSPSDGTEEITIPQYHSGYSEISCHKSGDELTCTGMWSQRQHLFRLPIAALATPHDPNLWQREDKPGTAL
jgi:hypothetical protein